MYFPLYNYTFILTAFSTVFLLDVGHTSAGVAAHLAHVVVVGSVCRTDRPAVDRVAETAAGLDALTPRHQTVHRRHAVRAEAARPSRARVLHVCRIDITTDRRRRQKTARQRQKKDRGRRR